MPDERVEFIARQRKMVNREIITEQEAWDNVAIAYGLNDANDTFPTCNPDNKTTPAVA